MGRLVLYVDDLERAEQEVHIPTFSSVTNSVRITAKENFLKMKVEELKAEHFILMYKRKFEIYFYEQSNLK